jgi:hypothetical protein
MTSRNLLQNKRVCKSLRELVRQNVSCDLYERVCYSKDAGPISFEIPDFIVQPRNEKEIQDVLRLANGQSIPVYVREGSTCVAGGGMPFTDGRLAYAQGPLHPYADNTSEDAFGGTQLHRNIKNCDKLEQIIANNMLEISNGGYSEYE